MAHLVTASALQFRGAPRRPRRRSLLDAQADRDQAGPANRRAGLPAHRDAAEYADRGDRRLLRLRLRLRDYLVYLVARDPRLDRRLRGPGLVLLAGRA